MTPVELICEVPKPSNSTRDVHGVLRKGGHSFRPKRCSGRRLILPGELVKSDNKWQCWDGRCNAQCEHTLSDVAEDPIDSALWSEIQQADSKNANTDVPE